MKRLFFALPIPEQWKMQFINVMKGKNYPGITWVPGKNLHITVHFLGATPEEKVFDVMQEGGRIASLTSSFEMKFGLFKTIFQKRKPAMIWAQFEENLSYENLCSILREKFPTGEKRKPNPHATLARIRQLKELPFQLPKAKSFSFTVKELELLESVTHPEGAEYKLLGKCEFK